MSERTPLVLFTDVQKRSVLDEPVGQMSVKIHIKPNLNAVSSWYQDFLTQVECICVATHIEPSKRPSLLDIGTPEAVEALRAFSAHSDAEVREEMAYRLAKLKGP